SAQSVGHSDPGARCTPARSSAAGVSPPSQQGAQPSDALTQMPPTIYATPPPPPPPPRSSYLRDGGAQLPAPPPFSSSSSLVETPTVASNRSCATLPATTAPIPRGRNDEGGRQFATVPSRQQQKQQQPQQPPPNSWNNITGSGIPSAEAAPTPLPTPLPTAAFREDEGRRERGRQRGDDDKEEEEQCWTDWEYPDKG
ncbi:unnamed protein product, partial [Pylaiella littoralis]